MTSIAYPSTLPGPSVAPVTSAERRLIAPRDGVRSSRAAQRDRLAMQDLTFEFLHFADCEAFRLWWRDTLVEGAAWFAATWPLPQGWVAGVRQFVGTPRWDYIPAAGWRVTARCQVRGRGVAPESYFRENFVEAIDGYVLTGGSLAPFSVTVMPTGNFLHIAGVTHPAPDDTIQRVIDPIVVRRVSLWFMVESVAPDDAAWFTLRNGATNYFTINPLRETAYDASRRVNVTMASGGQQPCSPAVITTGVWYTFDLAFSPVVNATAYTLRTAAGALVQAGTLTGTFAPPTIDRLEFWTDPSIGSCPTRYADISIR